MVKWKISGALKPLLLYGARQVGKSYSVLEFGQENYTQVLEVNFEQDQGARTVFELDLKPRKIVQALENLYNTKIDTPKRLIFFDEIQKCPRALTSLKYFAEEKKRGQSQYNVIAAGSLLGVISQRGGLKEAALEPADHATFPVGKVDEVIVYPLDFEEFLWAGGHNYLAEKIRESYASAARLDETLHQQALALYRTFLVVGGMPEVVSGYFAGNNYRNVQKNIIADYISDMTKYCEGVQALKNIDTYHSIAVQLGRENKKFIYSAIKKGAEGRTYYPSILWLKDARVALRCFKSTQGNLPPKASEERSSFKFYMSDTGLLCYQLQINEANLEVYNQNYRGAVSENYAACALQGKIQSLFEELHYWKTDEKKGSSEVDFLLATNDGTIPLEVKSSENVRSKSLRVFCDRFHPAYAIRTSAKNFGFENGIKSVPFYALFCLHGLV